MTHREPEGIMTSQMDFACIKFFSDFLRLTKKVRLQGAKFSEPIEKPTLMLFRSGLIPPLVIFGGQEGTV